MYDFHDVEEPKIQRTVQLYAKNIYVFIFGYRHEKIRNGPVSPEATQTFATSACVRSTTLHIFF